MATKNPSPLSIGRSLNFAAGRMNALCQHWLDPHGLSLPQWVVLSCLWREGALTIGELADRVGTGLPAASRIVDRMADRKLVARRRHEDDRRAMVVHLLERGENLRHLSDFHQRINAALFAGFSSEDQGLAFSLLERMQQNAENQLP
ncbi:MAG: MarR family transcriptional regulator [Pseudomonadota bacterium]